MDGADVIGYVIDCVDEIDLEPTLKGGKYD